MGLFHPVGGQVGTGSFEQLGTGSFCPISGVDATTPSPSIHSRQQSCTCSVDCAVAPGRGVFVAIKIRQYVVFLVVVYIRP